MIKNLGKRKLSRTPAHKRAMLRNMAASLLLHEQVKTTVAKAKEVRPFVESLLTKAKKLDVTARRAVAREINDLTVQKKIFEVLVPRYNSRPGGYTRLYRLGLRASDNAEIGFLKLVS